MNLLDAELASQLAESAGVLERDSTIRVVVFGSADPDYFLAHDDVEDLLARTAPPARLGGLKPFHQLLERYRPTTCLPPSAGLGFASGGVVKATAPAASVDGRYIKLSYKYCMLLA